MAGEDIGSEGRSPRVRGSPGYIEGGNVIPGSIPACAGEPRDDPRRRCAGRVDPRVCGGASCGVRRRTRDRGRSPRVRGSPRHRQDRRHHLGSIPACAGEPIRDWRLAFMERVDPRVCGGAHGPVHPSDDARGRSPRVRGSLSSPEVNAAAKRSIPACAGEPTIRPNALTFIRVDPRVCGGAFHWRRSGRSS